MRAAGAKQSVESTVERRLGLDYTRCVVALLDVLSICGRLGRWFAP